MLLIVDELNRIRVFVQSPAIDDLSVSGDHVHGTIHRQQRPIGIEKTALQQIGGANRANVAQVRSDSGSLAVDAMAARAAARPLEPSLAATRIAQGYRVGVEIAEVADIGDNPSEFRRVKPEGRHGRADDAVGENGAQIEIGRSTPQLAAAKVHAIDLIAIHAVADGALRGVNLGAITNVGRGILNGAILSLPDRAPERSGESQEGAHDRAGPPPALQHVQAPYGTEYQDQQNCHFDFPMRGNIHPPPPSWKALDLPLTCKTAKRCEDNPIILGEN